MATQFSNTLQASTSTDALFQAFCTFIDTILTAGGWVQTADTGQFTPATALHPTVASTKVGYRVYRMDDALQATAPVFLRIDYGAGFTNATYPGIWLTIGTGSNGAGTLTGVTLSNLQVEASASGTNGCDSYASADAGRLQLLLFVRGAANDLLMVSLERSKDANGVDTADGLLLAWNSTTGLNFSIYLIRAGGAQPPTETGLTLSLSNQATSAFSSNVGIGLPLFFKGIAQQPGMGMIAVNSGDFVAEANLTFAIYGTNHTYQLGNSATTQIQIPTGGGASVARASTRVGIRYE